MTHFESALGHTPTSSTLRITPSGVRDKRTSKRKRLAGSIPRGHGDNSAANGVQLLWGQFSTQGFNILSGDNKTKCGRESDDIGWTLQALELERKRLVFADRFLKRL